MVVRLERPDERRERLQACARRRASPPVLLPAGVEWPPGRADRSRTAEPRRRLRGSRRFRCRRGGRAPLRTSSSSVRSPARRSRSLGRPRAPHGPHRPHGRTGLRRRQTPHRRAIAPRSHHGASRTGRRASKPRVVTCRSDSGIELSAPGDRDVAAKHRDRLSHLAQAGAGGLLGCRDRFVRRCRSADRGGRVPGHGRGSPAAGPSAQRPARARVRRLSSARPAWYASRASA